MTIDVTHIDVKTLIPHREPFLLVDALTEYRVGVGLQAVKAVSRAEPWFQGHFPDFAILPGVLIIEALAQTCAIYMRLEESETPQSTDDIYVLLRTGVRNIKPVFPGTLLALNIELADRMGNFITFNVLASQGGKSCVRGKLTVGKASRQKMGN